MSHICEYFPCHEWEDDMSCENCYCPIYKQECERFGGTPKYLHTRVDIVKDCSECVLPHKENFKEIICEPNKKML